MKIAIIGSGRSRSTLLARYLHNQNKNLIFHDEYYTHAIRKGEYDLTNITTELFKDNDFIVKIMSHNITMDTNLSVFMINQYDEIHLIERHDFFDQCCSWQVCIQTDIWHLSPGCNVSGENQYDEIKQQKFTVDLYTILGHANSVSNYLKMKKYLNENDIPYKLHTYESAKKYGIQQYTISTSNLRYNNIITNYELKESVNLLFEKYFSYENASCDLEQFSAEVRAKFGA